MAAFNAVLDWFLGSIPQLRFHSVVYPIVVLFH